ncbi:helix-turn-helix domain-containing protein [Lacrimispora sp.]|uniref:helix-turn-helix domain-containing protein n=1 Tax=Lacrimispora sp. TaxID=2719234 RepID=UPI0028B220E7|nr:helix-turn-helix transcriptional regulator [Lacrimispora sp.]
MDYKEIGKNISTYRKAKKKTQKDLAALIDRAESSIQKYERGEVEIPMSVLQNIAAKLEIPIHYLVDWDGQKVTNTAIAGINKPLSEVLELIGYRLIYHTADSSTNSIIIVDNKESSITVTMDEFTELEKSTESYLNFKLHELFEKHNK